MTTTTPRTTCIPLRTALVACVTIGSAVGGTSAPAPITTPPPATGWEFRLEPYGWAQGLDGTTGVNDFLTNVNASMSDVLDHLDMAAALQCEARYGRWGIIADGNYSKLSVSGSPPGPLLSHASVDMKMFIGELYGAYRVSDSPCGFVDVYAGLRYDYLSVDLHADGALHGGSLDRSRSTNWTDPMVGLRGQWNINEKFFLAGKGDIGGFGVSSDLVWSLQATVGYNFTERISAELGYRYLNTDYSSSHFTYDLAQAGIFMGFNFKF